MAFERFTDRARNIVDLARRESQELGCDDVDTVHLLLGMIHEGRGVAGHVLSSVGVDAEKTLQAYERHRGAADVSLAEFETQSLLQAKQLHHNYAGTEHCILAICGFPDCRAVRVLADLGVAPQDVSREVLSLLGHDGDL